MIHPRLTTPRRPASEIAVAARRRSAIATVAAIAAIAIAACTLTLSLGDGERRTVAGELVTDVIVPTYEEVVERARELQTAAHAFDDGPTQATLDALRAAWRGARVPWKETDAFRFGPVTLQSLATAIDQAPIDAAKIELEIAGTGLIDAVFLADLGANKKGFHAIEYLVFDGAGVGDPAVLANLVAGDRRRAFIAACTDDLAANASKLRDAWVDRAGRLADPGSDNADYPTIQASIDALVNESVFQAEVVADTRLGKPLGTEAGGTPQPELQESGPSDHSIIDMTSTIRGIRNIYVGSRSGQPGRGIGKLVAAASSSVDRDVRAALDAAFAALAAIPPPYVQALLDGDPRVLAAYAAVQELQHLLATEVVATLGATLKFNSNDGD